jgi:hypothetical protein
MKKAIAALALGVVLAGSAFAQDSSKDVTTTSMAASNAFSMDMREAQWANYHVDKFSVNRFKAKGFTESETLAIANISWRTGLPMDYIGERVRVSGTPLTHLAAMWGVSTTALDDPIIGFNGLWGQPSSNSSTTGSM